MKQPYGSTAGECYCQEHKQAYWRRRSSCHGLLSPPFGTAGPRILRGGVASEANSHAAESSCSSKSESVQPIIGTITTQGNARRIRAVITPSRLTDKVGACQFN